MCVCFFYHVVWTDALEFCGLWFAENGRVYAAGLNDFGQLGLSDSVEYAMVCLLLHSPLLDS